MNIRGFGGILLAFALAVSALLFFSQQVALQEQHTYLGEIPKIPNHASSFTLNLTAMMHDCNTLSETLTSCVDTNAAFLITQTQTTYLQCAKTPATFTHPPDTNEVNFVLHCTQTLLSTTHAPLIIDLNRTIVIVKNN